MTVLITGAGTGLGFEVALRLAKQGLKLSLVWRSWRRYMSSSRKPGSVALSALNWFRKRMT